MGPDRDGNRDGEVAELVERVHHEREAVDWLWAAGLGWEVTIG